MKRFISAFTLIEVIISLTIIVITAAFILPSVNNFLIDNQDKVALRQIVNAISFAKSESQTRNISISICKSDDQKTCGRHWENGQLIFLDEEGDGVVHHAKQILTILKPALHGRLHWRSFPLHKPFLTFSPIELKENNGTFWYCRNAAAKWAISINQAGRARVVYPNQDGVIKDSHGQALPC